MLIAKSQLLTQRAPDNFIQFNCFVLFADFLELFWFSQRKIKADSSKVGGTFSVLSGRSSQNIGQQAFLFGKHFLWVHLYKNPIFFFFHYRSSLCWADLVFFLPVEGKADDCVVRSVFFCRRTDGFLLNGHSVSASFSLYCNKQLTRMYKHFLLSWWSVWKSVTTGTLRGGLALRTF